MIRQGVEDLGGTILFATDCLRALAKGGLRGRAVLDQMYAVGVRSLPTVVVTGLFVGAIMAIQTNLQLRDYGAQGFLGGLSTSVTIRNVGPVLIAFLLSGKVGAYTSAELGTMQVTEQMSAIRCLGADPIRYIILPRMTAVVISSFLLLIVGLMMTIAGGALIAVLLLNINASNFVAQIPRMVSWWSVGTGVAKSFVFGIIIAIVCCYRGYHAKGGAVGVGNTVRTTAMETLVCIVVTDFTMSTISTFLYELFWRWGWVNG